MGVHYGVSSPGTVLWNEYAIWYTCGSLDTAEIRGLWLFKGRFLHSNGITSLHFRLLPIYRTTGAGQRMKF